MTRTFALAAALALSGCATHAPVRAVGHGAKVAVPIGYVMLCVNRPTFCNPPTTTAGRGTFADLERINAEVNAYPYASESVEDWTPISVAGSGDCDSYATEKMERLLAAGWSPLALRLAVGTVGGKGHLVLLVDLDGQTWVLDNLRSHPWPTEVQMIDYPIVKAQIAGTLYWEGI